MYDLELEQLDPSRDEPTVYMPYAVLPTYVGVNRKAASFTMTNKTLTSTNQFEDQRKVSKSDISLLTRTGAQILNS